MSKETKNEDKIKRTISDMNMSEKTKTNDGTVEKLILCPRCESSNVKTDEYIDWWICINCGKVIENKY